MTRAVLKTSFSLFWSSKKGNKVEALQTLTSDNLPPWREHIDDQRIFQRGSAVFHAPRTTNVSPVRISKVFPWQETFKYPRTTYTI